MRNAFAVVLGIAVYTIVEYVAILILGFLLTVPILSQLMTCFVIPDSVFLAATVPYIAIFPTMLTIQVCSKHKDVNYSGAIVFTILFIITIFNFTNYTIENQFQWMQLFTSIIKCGFFVNGIVTSANGEI